MDNQMLTFLALFATAMFDKLGVDWAGSLLGFLAIAFMPIPFLFYIYGERLRKTSAYAPTDFGKKNDDEESQEKSDEQE
jgi:DHA1 family multidrug resistance protein-like MFS transporter